MATMFRPRKTLNVTSAKVRDIGRFSKPPNKLYLDPIRWMGCVIAVYDCTVREKAVGGGSKAPRVPKQNPKRRWKRGGHRVSRKSRQLTTADPGPQQSSFHPKPSPGRHLLAYLERLSRDVVKFETIFKRTYDAEQRGRLRLVARRRRARFVELVSRSRGSDTGSVVGKASAYKALEAVGAEKLPVRRSFVMNETNTGRSAIFAEDILDDFALFVEHRPDLNNPEGRGIQRFGSMVGNSRQRHSNPTPRHRAPDSESRLHRNNPPMRSVVTSSRAGREFNKRGGSFVVTAAPCGSCGSTVRFVHERECPFRRRR
jgi:hypothetical protein